MNLPKRAFIVGVMAPLTERTVLLPREAPAVLGLVFVAKDGNALCDVELIVRDALAFTMRQRAVEAPLTRALLELRAENVRLDLDIWLALDGVVVIDSWRVSCGVLLGHHGHGCGGWGVL